MPHTTTHLHNTYVMLNIREIFRFRKQKVQLFFTGENPLFDPLRNAMFLLCILQYSSNYGVFRSQWEDFNERKIVSSHYGLCTTKVV